MRLNGDASLGTEGLQLTPAAVNEAGSAWSTKPIDPRKSFDTEFQFWLHDSTLANPSAADGFTFAIQASKPGLDALGGDKGQWGYGAVGHVECANAPPGITHSLAVVFNLYRHSCDASGNWVAILKNGITTQKYSVGTPSIPLYGDPHRAWVNYNAPAHLMRVYVGDQSSRPKRPLLTYTVNLGSVVGAKAAYAGFTAATGGSNADQNILSWTMHGKTKQFGRGPATYAGIALNGSGGIGRAGLHVTSEVVNEAGSAWSSVAIDTGTSFDTAFRFWQHDSTAVDPTPGDGLTFTIQNSNRGLKALGGNKGQYGYGAAGHSECRKSPAGVGRSLAVVFNLFRHACDSSRNFVAILENGITTQKLAVGTPPVQLYGKPHWAWVTYDARVHLLSVYVGDQAVRPHRPILTFTGNLATIVGGKHAYIGFTGATGRSNADQDILGWTLGAKKLVATSS
jgi:hypothetical protein